MTMTDPLGDMLTRIRNGQRCGMSTVNCPASKLRANVLDALQREGYIRGFSWSGRRVVIVITTKQTLMRFIINTLIHFGASCGQIQVDRNKMENPSEGVWLLMLQYQSAE